MESAQTYPGRRVELNTRRKDASGADGLQPDAMVVERFLPTKGLRTVGAWCFLDRFGPDDVTSGEGMRVAPHPHTGLQTVTWLLEGRVLHLDSLGSRQTIEPGQLNLMTSGDGISHSEESPPDRPPLLQGVQLWVALPDDSRSGAAAFDHHADLPVVALDGVTATVLLGTLAGSTSPARAYSPIVGAELLVAGDGRVPLETAWEHALLVLSGEVSLDGEPLPHDGLVHLPPGPQALSLSGSGRVLLVGGEPFGEELVMWWNFVARSHDEVVAAREQWQADDGRFGTVTGFDGARLPAPELPALRLRPRGRS